MAGKAAEKPDRLTAAMDGLRTALQDNHKPAMRGAIVTALEAWDGRETGEDEGKPATDGLTP